MQLLVSFCGKKEEGGKCGNAGGSILLFYFSKSPENQFQDQICPCRMRVPYIFKDKKT